MTIDIILYNSAYHLKGSLNKKLKAAGLETSMLGNGSYTGVIVWGSKKIAQEILKPYATKYGNDIKVTFKK